MIYTTCKYAPAELFMGFGQETERLDPSPVSFSCADGCAHPNLCGFAKAVIEEVNARNVRELVFTDCCDAMRRTYDVLLGRKLEFLYFLPLPHKTGEREIRLFALELKKLVRAYAAYSGCSFSTEKALRALEESMRGKENRPGADYVTVLGAHGGARLIEGARASLPGVSVIDETCSGNRVFANAELPDADDEEAFFLFYAGLLLKGLMPCLRMYETGGRAAQLAASAKNAQEKTEGREIGRIYHTIKFCDYYSFEYSDLKESTGVPLLKIETDTTPQSSGQLRTRIEAFGESIGAGAVRQTEAELEQFRNAKYIAGIDSGSTSTDVVIMDRKKNILGTAILPTGMSASKSAEEALRQALEEAGLDQSEVGAIVATGYGRDAIGMEKRTITEITCHARGAHFLFPGARTIIDIGGQDSKVIRIDEEGNVAGFIMNDKCAAGTGRFLEMQARALGLSMEEMSRAGLAWKEEVQISNMCTVFAESEVVSLVAKDTPISDIIHGLNESVASKTVSLITRGKGEREYAMTGGVSRNLGVVRCLSDKLGCPVATSDKSQLCGAIGAALLGMA